MTNSSAFPVANPYGQTDASVPRASAVSSADQRAFQAATARLEEALDAAAQGKPHGDIETARLSLRELAVKLRDAGFWRSDKQGLRATVSLLWRADRFVSDQALRSSGSDR